MVQIHLKKKRKNFFNSDTEYVTGQNHDFFVIGTGV